MKTYLGGLFVFFVVSIIRVIEPLGFYYRYCHYVSQVTYDNERISYLKSAP